jgi:predicted small lipoprotein YifL
MRALLILILIFIVSCFITGCGKNKAPVSPAASVEAPSLKIAEDQRKQLEKAKEVAQTVQKAADDQKKPLRIFPGSVTSPMISLKNETSIVLRVVINQLYFVEST